MPETYLSADVVTLLKEEGERLKRQLEFEMNTSEVIKQLVLEARRLRDVEAKVLQLGAAVAGRKGPRVF